MRAAHFTGLGDPSILTLVDVPARDPGPGEVQLRVTSAGLNRADANYRRGRYLVKSPGASRSGFEGAGIVTAVGREVARGGSAIGSACCRRPSTSSPRGRAPNR